MAWKGCASRISVSWRGFHQERFTVWKRRSGAGQGVPPQPAVPVCPDVLRAGKRFVPADGYFRPFQCCYHPYLNRRARFCPRQANGARLGLILTTQHNFPYVVAAKKLPYTSALYRKPGGFTSPFPNPNAKEPTGYILSYLACFLRLLSDLLRSCNETKDSISNSIQHKEN